MGEALFDVLRKVTTATITTMLLKKGIRRCWMNGPKPSFGRFVAAIVTYTYRSLSRT